VGSDYIQIREERFFDPSVGARFVCPNPLMRGRYLVVQAGVSAEAVERAGTLPAFLGDYIVFDRRFKSKFKMLVLGSNPDIESGYFTEDWQLPPKKTNTM
jgi:hypothetical protein